MKTLNLILVTLALGIAFSGCSTQTVNTVERADPLARPNVIQDRRIVTDSGLSRAVEILQVNEGTVSGDILKIQVLLASTKSKPLNINYAFEWYDVDGMLVTGSSSNWKSLRLMGKETKAISAVAPSPRVVDFVLKLQEPTVKKLR